VASLINENRPPVFCPGCSHERVLHALDQAFTNMGLQGHQICMVSDIGCSGLFDTFFNTHAFHGLHGRALTYATGLKLAQPELNVVVTMGDGGLGIGGHHLLSACRRNLDLTLLVLNNFNFGMTGGQFSATTPPEARVGSGFLNQIERPLDAGRVAAAAGAPYVVRASAYAKDLPRIIEEAIRFQGFSLLDLWGVCPGRFLRLNKLTPQMIDQRLDGLEPLGGPVEANQRPEYGRAYLGQSAGAAAEELPAGIEAVLKPPQASRQEVLILGSAGQRVITAGEILGLAGLTAGLNVTQKNEYNITVLRGPSISELILSPEAIDYTGSQEPTAVLAVAAEGVARRRGVFGQLKEGSLVIQAEGLDLPQTRAQVVKVDFKAQGLKTADWSLAALAALAKLNRVLSMEMLQAALQGRFRGKVLEASRAVVEKVSL